MQADAKQLLGAATRISCLRRKLPTHRPCKLVRLLVFQNNFLHFGLNVFDAAHVVPAGAMHDGPAKVRGTILGGAAAAGEVLGVLLVHILLALVAVSQKLMTQRYHGDESKKDVHEKDVEYLARSRKAAEFCAAHLGWQTVPCTCGDGMRSIEEIGQEVRRRVDAALAE